MKPSTGYPPLTDVVVLCYVYFKILRDLVSRSYLLITKKSPSHYLYLLQCKRVDSALPMQLFHQSIAGRLFELQPRGLVANTHLFLSPQLSISPGLQEPKAALQG